MASIDHMIDWYSIQNENGGGREQVISSRFLFYCVFVVAVVVVLMVKINFCPVLSCFINFIFNSFVISYWMYFVVIERKKKGELFRLEGLYGGRRDSPTRLYIGYPIFRLFKTIYRLGDIGIIVFYKQVRDILLESAKTRYIV